MDSATQPQTSAAAAATGEWRRSWPAVLAAFAAMFTVFGIAYSFGAFFDRIAAEFHIGRGATSSIFSITGFLYFTLGALSGRAADRLGPRRVLLAGALAMGLGLIGTALAPWFWLAWLSYGLGVGIGTACGYVPMVAVVGNRFVRARSLAVGLAVTGIGLGTLLVPLVAALLIRAYGWRTSYLVFGLAGTAVLVVAAATVGNTAALVGSQGQLRQVLRRPAFRLLYAGGLLTSVALFIAFVHLAPYARRQGADQLAAAALISVIGAGSVLGRVGLGGIAVRAGALRTFQAAVLVLTLSFLVWLAIPGYLGLVAFATLLGIGYGGWVAISPSVVADLFGAEGLGGSVGALYTSAGVGALLGPWLAGALADLTGGYSLVIVGAVVLALLASGFTLSVRPGM